jgi:[ribosomal protein S18]-alanine N-acetyltransferase
VPYLIEPMQTKDIPEVIDIERESFSMTWPANSYKRELEENRLARYVVLRYQAANDESPFPRKARDPRPFPLSLLPAFDRPRPGPDDPPVVGYGGLWLMVDEAHVTSIAVRPEFRGKGLGQLVMLALFGVAIEKEARWMTLEVRVSNTGAQALYKKLGFREAGIRPRYYTDNNEDAVIMWSEDLRSQGFRQRYQRLRSDLAARIEWSVRQ